MHSSYKISNSSDSIPISIDRASILKVNSDKKSEELKFFIESFIEVSKLSANPEDDEKSSLDNSETLKVEPHSFNLVSTPITRELLIAEEKSRARELARAEKHENVDSNDSCGEEAHVWRLQDQ